MIRFPDIVDLLAVVPASTIPDGRCGGWYVETRKYTQEQSDELLARAQNGNCGYIAWSPPNMLHKWLGGPLLAEAMSDTCAELSYNAAFVRMATGRVLITGLGLGLLPAALLRKPEVTRIDIVELEADVIGLVKPHLQDERIVIHHADAFTWQLPFPHYMQWDFAWHSILYWGGLMSELTRQLRVKYREHTLAQLSWGEGTPWWR